MVIKRLVLPIARGAEFVLEKLGEVEMQSLWECKLVHDGRRVDLGSQSVERYRDALTKRLLDPSVLQFVPATRELPEHAGLMSLVPLGPMLYVVRVGEGLELAWQNERTGDMRLHRTGIIIDRDLVATWPAILASVAEQENWPPSKLYRLLRDPEFLFKKILTDECEPIEGQSAHDRRVAAALQLFNGMTPSERDAFRVAVQRMVADGREEVRNIGMDLQNRM